MLEELIRQAVDSGRLVNFNLIGVEDKWSCSVRAKGWKEISVVHGEDAIEAVTKALRRAIRSEDDDLI
jgi:hypothetical protein